MSLIFNEINVCNHEFISGSVNETTVLFRITAKVVALFPERLIILDTLFNAWLISNFQVTFQPRYRGYIKSALWKWKKSKRKVKERKELWEKEEMKKWL